MNKLSISSVIVLSSALVSVQALAIQTPGSINTPSGIDYTPTVSLGVKKAEFNESLVTTLNPVVNASLLNGTNAYSGVVDLAIELDDKASRHNSVDLLLGVNGDFEIDATNFVSAALNVEFGHEDTLDTNPTGDITRLITPTLSGSYERILNGTPGVVTVLANLSDTTYTNFEDITDYSESTNFALGVVYSYEQDAQITYLTEASFETAKYKKDDPTGVKDSDTYNALVGVNFEASAVTTGEVKVGYLGKQYENEDKSNFSGVSWTGLVNWAPKSFSNYEFTTGFVVNDATGAEDYVGETSIGALWSHDWNADWSSKASIDYTNENFEGIDQKDDTFELNATGYYSFIASSFKGDVSFGATYTQFNTTGATSAGTDEAVFILGLDAML